MDVSVFAMIFGSLRIIVQITQRLNETSESVRHPSNEFNSLKKELDILTDCLKVGAEKIQSSREIEISIQGSLTALSDNIESARRLIADIKQALESAPGRIPDERRRFKWIFYDTRSYRKRLIRDLTIKIQTLSTIIQVLGIDYAQARARPPQLSYLTGKSTSSLTAEELEIQTADLAIPGFVIPVSLQRSPDLHFPRYRSSERSSYSAVKLLSVLVCIGTSSFSSAVLRQYDLTHPTRRRTNADGLGGITAENAAPEIDVYKCPRLGLSGEEISLTEPSRFLCQGLKGLHDWTQTFPSFSEAVSNPSPTVFVGSIFTFGLATAAYYQLHKRDKYQDVFLIGGVLAGTAAGWLSNTDVQGVLLSFLQICVLVSLVLSSCLHGVAGPRWQGNEDNEALLLGWDEIENMGKESGLR